MVGKGGKEMKDRVNPNQIRVKMPEENLLFVCAFYKDLDINDCTIESLPSQLIKKALGKK